jgi:hypothetical protein
MATVPISSLGDGGTARDTRRHRCGRCVQHFYDCRLRLPAFNPATGPPNVGVHHRSLHDLLRPRRGAHHRARRSNEQPCNQVAWWTLSHVRRGHRRHRCCHRRATPLDEPTTTHVRSARSYTAFAFVARGVWLRRRRHACRYAHCVSVSRCAHAHRSVESERRSRSLPARSLQHNLRQSLACLRVSRWLAGWLADVLPPRWQRRPMHTTPASNKSSISKAIVTLNRQMVHMHREQLPS